MPTNMIGLSFDTDWQDGEILKVTLDLLKTHQVKATFFMTGKTKLKIRGHELAIHPYFEGKNSFQSTINKLLTMFPQAKGLRSHHLHIDYDILSYLETKKFLYDSNYLMYLQENIRAFRINNFYELPIYYMDFYQILTTKNPQFKLAYLKLNRPGLKILAFHPIHVYLNTHNLNDYLQYKRDKDHTAHYINRNQLGIQTLFLELLAYLKKTNQKDCQLKRIANAYS